MMRVFVCMCPGLDLNQHVFRHQLLRLAWLPITPPGQNLFNCVLRRYAMQDAVPRAGIEPARPCDREILSLLRLPISPPRQAFSLRRGRELNPRMSVLQTEALPLRHHAILPHLLVPQNPECIKERSGTMIW